MDYANTSMQHLNGSIFDLRWGDMDAFGHLNNTGYFRFFEQTRMDWLATHGHYLSDTQQSFVIVDAHCEFLKPIVYPSTIVVDLFAGPPGRSSFQTYYQISDATQTNVLYARGRSKVVWIDLKTSSSTPLPDFLLAHLPKSE